MEERRSGSQKQQDQNPQAPNDRRQGRTVPLRVGGNKQSQPTQEITQTKSETKRQERV